MELVQSSQSLGTVLCPREPCWTGITGRTGGGPRSKRTILYPSWAHLISFLSLGLCQWLSSKESACQCGRHRRRGFNPWIGKIPFRKTWQPTLVFLLGKSHGQRSLESQCRWGCKELDTIEHARVQFPLLPVCFPFLFSTPQSIKKIPLFQWNFIISDVFWIRGELLTFLVSL